MNRIRTATLCALLLASGLVSAADAPGTVNPEKHLADLLIAEGTEHIAHRFSGSGLADEDITRTVESIIEGYAGCLVRVLRASELPEAVQVLAILSQGLTMEELDDLESDASDALNKAMRSLDEQMDRCREEIDQQHGLPSLKLE